MTMTSHALTSPPRLRDIVRSGLRRYPGQLADAIASPRRARTAAHDLAPISPVHPVRLGAAWLGHATTLLTLAGRTLLADPVFSERVGVRLGPWTLGPRRLDGRHGRPPALPTPEFILITHAHFDHLDRPTLLRLADARTTVVTACNTRRLIPRGFADIIELPWQEWTERNGVRITALRPDHWGARTAVDRRRRCNSYLVETASERVLIAGDTAYCDTYDGLGPLDLAVFGIGAYDPWVHAHATPEQVWSMFEAAGGRHLLPVHHSTFELSDEHPDEPMDRLLAAAGHDAHRVIGRAPGDLWVRHDGSRRS